MAPTTFRMCLWKLLLLTVASASLASGDGASSCSSCADHHKDIVDDDDPSPPRKLFSGDDPDLNLLLSSPQPDNLRQYLYDLTQRSHVAGTKGDFENAAYVHSQFQSMIGVENSKIDVVPVMLSYPKLRPRLSTDFFEAKLAEDSLEEDETSGSTVWRNHTFLAYSPGGTVTAKLVYANYGRPQDFDTLKELGVSVYGTIVIMRYGECFRGLKVMNAEARGAVGTIIYTDPMEDGFRRGPVYPNGPWRPPSSVQRGSVQFNSKCAGDPWRLYFTNQGLPSPCGYNASELVPSHPALPISYEDAQPLLESIGGPQGPDVFQGGLDFNYTVGPSEYYVTLSTYNQNTPGTIPNVIATIPGSDPSAGSIILGNHRDAWVFGAVDPNSGTAVLLELARSFSMLLQKGWKPRRTILLASWSGEEYGLLGSTAFAELSPDIVKDAIAYLNVDCAVKGNNGPLSVSLTHSLEELFVNATQTIPAPNQCCCCCNQTLYDKWDQQLNSLGSGSDYTVFLDRLGVVSLDMSYEGDYGVYHSVYDSFSWMEQQGDPSFEIHQAMTRLWILLTYRLASEEILPLRMSSQALRLQRDLQDLQASVAGVDLNWTEILVAAEDFRQAAASIDAQVQQARLSTTTSSAAADFSHSLRASRPTTPQSQTSINDRLAFTERRFLSQKGLPNRPWFRHILQAPGYYLGYGSQALPGIAESLHNNNTQEAKAQVEEATALIREAAKYLRGDDDPVGSLWDLDKDDFSTKHSQQQQQQQKEE